MLVKRALEYVGFKDPQTIHEIRVEVLGLRHAIKQAEEMICRLELAVSISELKNAEAAKENDERAQSESKPAETDTETQEGSEDGAVVSG